MSPRWLLAIIASLVILPRAEAAESLGFIVPDGFEVLPAPGTDRLKILIQPGGLK